MSNKLVIKIIDESEGKEIGALFSSSGVPKDANYLLEMDESTKQMKLKAVDQMYDQKYSGSADKYSEYYIGVRNRGVLEIRSLSLFRMSPTIELADNTSNLPALTVKEQMEEIKEKFGSRKTQRSLVSKRKYAIEFGEEDVQQIEAKTKSIVESVLSQSESETTINDTLDILPKQNRDAICVQEVYDLNEIIIEKERNVLIENETQLYGQISDIYIKNLISDQRLDSEKKLIANYIYVIINLLSLKGSDLRKPNPLPTVPMSVKDIFFERYFCCQIINSKPKYVLNPRQKDQLIIYGIILSFIVNNFRPIDMEAMQKTFRVQLKQLRKVCEIVGAYVENLKNSSGVNTKAVVFRLPLNTFTGGKSFKKR